LKNKVAIARLQISFAILFWGVSFIATKIALRVVNPPTIIWMRFTIGLLVLGIAGTLQKKISMPTLKDLGYFAMLGAIGITLHQWLQSNGLVTAQATTSAFIVATVPVFMALLSWLVLKEKLSLTRWGGILLATLGVVLIISRGDLSTIVKGRFGTIGDLLVLGSAIVWAIYSIISHKGLKSFSALGMLFYVMAFGWVFITILLFATGPGLGEIPHLQADGWLGITFLGVFCSGLAFLFWYNGLQVLPASQVGAFLYFEPLVTMVAASLLLGEQMRWLAILGGLIVLLGVWIVNREEK
jgi:drug/metabolite transporter (DMT)-like permease